MSDVRLERWPGEIRRAVLAGLRAYNDGFLPKNRKGKPLVISLRAEGRVVGGLCGITLQEWCLVQEFWIDAAHRKQGIGSRIMAMMEEEAAKRGVKHVQLDTGSFQAPEFYKKLGYVEFGRLDNYINGHTYYWLKKDL
ncbi:MAG: GNAT family N-acetyltransferase [Proteobacteria bacterium]|nr:GNAT family N-acetyltransferase [Pseudomonadota bacterium]